MDVSIYNTFSVFLKKKEGKVSECANPKTLFYFIFVETSKFAITVSNLSGKLGPFWAFKKYRFINACVF